MKSGYGKHGKVKNAGEYQTALGANYPFLLKAKMGKAVICGNGGWWRGCGPSRSQSWQCPKEGRGHG